MTYISDGTLGVDLTKTDSTPRHQLGIKLKANDGVYQYVKNSGSAIAQYALVKISGDGNFTVAEGTTTLLPSTQPASVGIAQVAIAAGSTTAQYGWVLRQGYGRVKAAASCAQDVELYTTATAGVVDDSATTKIKGLKIITTITSATDTPCFAAIEMYTPG